MAEPQPRPTELDVVSIINEVQPHVKGEDALIAGQGVVSGQGQGVAGGSIARPVGIVSYELHIASSTRLLPQTSIAYIVFRAILTLVVDGDLLNFDVLAVQDAWQGDWNIDKFVARRAAPPDFY